MLQEYTKQNWGEEDSVYSLALAAEMVFIGIETHEMVCKLLDVYNIKFVINLACGCPMKLSGVMKK